MAAQLSFALVKAVLVSQTSAPRAATWAVSRCQPSKLCSFEKTTEAAPLGRILRSNGLKIFENDEM